MKHQLNINGAADAQTIDIVVDGTATQFDLTQDIKAKDIFDLMNFSKGDTYQFVKGECGAVNSSSFDAFCALIQNICDKANDLCDSDETQISNEDQAASSLMDV